MCIGLICRGFLYFEQIVLILQKIVNFIREYTKSILKNANRFSILRIKSAKHALKRATTIGPHMSRKGVAKKYS